MPALQEILGYFLNWKSLIGVGIKAEYLNDDKLGRVFDKLFIKGLDTAFLAVSLNAVKIYQVSLSSSHLDSTSFHVDGEYENSLPSVIFENQKESGSLEKENEESQSPQAIKLTYGYSRDHRPDLKQFITQLVCSGDGDIPIYIKAAKNLVMSLAELEFVKSEKAGYSYAEKKITYGDIEQRWLVVQSQDRKKSDLKKLSKRIEKALTIQQCGGYFNVFNQFILLLFNKKQTFIT
ncbi:hypothetical protein BMF77_02936 [Dolichospermum sp. UHCC 0315A]|jgi:hypothetical protein|uniref:DUF4277 domain-containing protein n=1 Tax=Dolichospermum sp. UHCC 0315A TaxID=1914871 RepID=UPI0011E8213E|nr:DUF4277 domain-containing protein [Dolichospermum sp. UHCC 0315A]QEI42329.1 hypothetical protein BMF77_02936 [Dolichospermum sp. UHCC 0315A]